MLPGDNNLDVWLNLFSGMNLSTSFVLLYTKNKPTCWYPVQDVYPYCSQCVTKIFMLFCHGDLKDNIHEVYCGPIIVVILKLSGEMAIFHIMIYLKKKVCKNDCYFYE